MPYILLSLWKIYDFILDINLYTTNFFKHKLPGQLLFFFYLSHLHKCPFKDIYSCPIEIIKGLTDKGQFQYLTGLKGPTEGTYLYITQFLTLR